MCLDDSSIDLHYDVLFLRVVCSSEMTEMIECNQGTETTEKGIIIIETTVTIEIAEIIEIVETTEDQSNEKNVKSQDAR